MEHCHPSEHSCVEHYCPSEHSCVEHCHPSEHPDPISLHWLSPPAHISPSFLLPLSSYAPQAFRKFLMSLMKMPLLRFMVHLSMQAFSFKVNSLLSRRLSSYLNLTEIKNQSLPYFLSLWFEHLLEMFQSPHYPHTRPPYFPRCSKESSVMSMMLFPFSF